MGDMRIMNGWFCSMCKGGKGKGAGGDLMVLPKFSSTSLEHAFGGGSEVQNLCFLCTKYPVVCVCLAFELRPPPSQTTKKAFKNKNSLPYTEKTNPPRKTPLLR